MKRFIMVLCIIIILGVWGYFSVFFLFCFLILFFILGFGGRGSEHVVKCLFLKIVSL